MKRRIHYCKRLIGPLILRIAVCGLAAVGCAKFHPQPISSEQTAETFNQRSLSDPRFVGFLKTNHVAAPQRHDAWNLDALTLAAFYYQPALAEARTQFPLAQAAQITAGERPNPSVSVVPGFDNGIPGNPSPFLVTVSTDWPIETAGKRRKRAAQAGHLAEAAYWNVIGAVWQARSRVRAALLALYSASETESFLARQISAQSNVVHLLEAQFSAGNIAAFDVTQARILFETTGLQVQAASGQYTQARVQMATALGVPLPALEGIKFSFARLENFPTELTKPEIRRRALLNRSDVRGALAEYAASQSALQLEIARQYPDLHLGPGYAWNAGSAGDNEWNLGLTLTLPIMNHNQGAVAEATAKRAQAGAHFLTVQATALGEIDGVLAAYNSALQQSVSAKTLLNNLRQRVNSVRSKKEAGELDSLAVANAELEFETSALNQLTYAIKAQQALGQLEDAVQGPLTLPPALLQVGEKKVVP